MNILAVLLIHLFFQVTPQPTVPPTIEGLQENLDAIRATQEALQAEGLEFDFGQESVMYQEEELMPDMDTATRDAVFGYMKWIASDASITLFGPFAPVVQHLMILLSLVMFGVVRDIAKQILGTIIKVALWLANWIRRLIELIPFVQ